MDKLDILNISRSSLQLDESAEEGRYNTFFLKKEHVLRKDENRNMDGRNEK
jgi:hypothetical protein